MNVKPTPLAGCFLIAPDIYEDQRGAFYESFNREAFARHVGRPVDFVQDNHSISHKGVLRGLHFQAGEHAQAKLVQVVSGEAYDVVVDLRKDSDTYGEHLGIILSGDTHHMLFIPGGMAHGFVSLADNTIFEYKCDNYYHKESEGGIIYNDPDLGIDWGYPEDQLILSEKDRILPAFKDWEKW